MRVQNYFEYKYAHWVIKIILKNVIEKKSFFCED